MSSMTLHPDPQLFPVGTTVKVFKVPAGAPASWEPSGSALSEPSVETTGVLTVTGLTAGERYVAEATVSTKRHTLYFSGGEAAAGAAVTSINGKTGEVTLGASDVEAVGTASPAFTGNPTAPTQAAGNNSTRLANTAYADRARNEAEEASTSRLAVHATISGAATLTANQLTPVDTTAGSVKVKLPTGQSAGTLIAVEKLDSSANEVIVEGSIREEEITTGGLKLQKETAFFVAKSGGSWWPISSHKTLSSLDARYRLATTAIPLNTRETWGVAAPEVGTADGRPVVFPAAGETPKAVRIDYEILEGTSATFKLQKNGVDMTGFTGLEAKKEAKHTTPTAVALAEGDVITLVFTAVSGTPKHFSATLHTSHTV